ncbi:MAG: hypothetical protein JW927_16265 [Deltaproteobacteria bacterium]|nr:hypothetical protein [Deltaproteobacteria bacterium]
MLVNLKTCFFISIFIAFILPDFAVSGENKIEEHDKASNKMTLEKKHKKKCRPRIDERYSMMIIGPDCHSEFIDPGIIAKNTFDPNVHAELRIINPYTKHESSGCKKENHGSLQHKPGISWVDKLFSMNVIKPDPEIGTAIVKNTFDLNTYYEGRIVDPYSRNKTHGYHKPGRRHK